METFKVQCKWALFLLHFLIYCNACQIEMRGFKSCGIHPRHKRSSPVSGNLTASQHTQTLAKFWDLFPFQYFYWALFWVLGYLNEQKVHLMKEGMLWSTDFCVALNTYVKLEVWTRKCFLRQGWRAKIEEQSFSMLFFFFLSSNCVTWST